MLGTFWNLTTFIFTTILSPYKLFSIILTVTFLKSQFYLLNQLLKTYPCNIHTLQGPFTYTNTTNVVQKSLRWASCSYLIFWLNLPSGGLLLIRTHVVLWTQGVVPITLLSFTPPSHWTYWPDWNVLFGILCQWK